MTSTVNAVLQALGKPIMAIVNDSVVANSSTTQAGATPLRSAVNRVVKGGSNFSCVLPNMITEEAADMVFVVNVSGSTILVYCALGDTMNGSTNGSLSIATGGFGMFLQKKRTDTNPGGVGYVAPDWRAQAYT